MRWAASATVLLFGALGFVPQFGGPGYEAALAAGLILPLLTALCVSEEISRARAEPRAAFGLGVAAGLALSGIAFVVILLHGLRVGLCDPGEGLLLFLLGPSFGAVLGGVTGAAAGLFVERRRSRRYRRWLWLVALSLLGPLLCVIVSLVRFYTSPMVFAYDPYAGYFSGPLYDTVIGSLWPLATYRIGTLASLCALWALSALLERDAEGRLRFRSGFRRDVAAGGVGAALLSALVTLSGAELGHYSTTKSIERALGREVAYGRCDVVFSSAIPRPDALRLGRDCDAHLRQLGRFFGTPGPERVRVFLFANDAEKGRLMGASRTYIAKPWRKEVYLQGAPYPHPVLGHELAHVVSGSFAPGPFHVAGPLGGWIPDPGRIEGVAVAAAPDENDELSLEEWAAAQLATGLLPSFDSLFKLSFFGQPASRAYTAAGAFMRFIRKEFGAAALRRWYGGESIEAVTGHSMPALDARFRAVLAQVKLPESVLTSARARFDRPSFFQRRCPRVIDRLVGDAGARFNAGDIQGAREAYRQILTLDAGDANARIGLIACSAREGDLERARKAYANLATRQDAPVWANLVALEAEGDLLLRQGELEAARAVYGKLAESLTDADRLRTLDIKRRVSHGIGREAIVMLLIGDELGPSWDVAAGKLGEWAALEPSSGLADYLFGRNLILRGRHKNGLFYLERALSRGLADGSVLDETLRLRLVAACAIGDLAGAKAVRDQLASRLRATARKESLGRFAERCGL